MILLISIKNFMTYTIFNISLFRYITAILIVICFFLLKSLFSAVVLKLLKKFEHNLGIQISSQLTKTLNTAIRALSIIAGLYTALCVLNPPADIRLFFKRLIISLVFIYIFWVAYYSSDTATSIFLKHIRGTGASTSISLRLLFSNVIKALILVIGMTVILQVWGYNLGGLLTGLGLGGLAFALAAKDTVANLFGSVMIMLDRPFIIGDWITTSKVEGVVDSIGLRSTRLRTVDQAIVTIPNSILSNEFITNMSTINRQRISLKLSLSPSTTTEQLNSCISKIQLFLKNHNEIDNDKVSVYFDGFNCSKLNIVTIYFIHRYEWKKHIEILQEINLGIKQILDELSITIIS